MGASNADFHESRLAIPAEPGTVPIPKGHVRLFHYTNPENLVAIRSQGLIAQEDSRSTRQGEPAMVWASETQPENTRPVVEFHLPQQVWEQGAPGGFGRAAVAGPVSPSSFIAIHEPWHQHARSILSTFTPTEISNGILDQFKGQDPEWDKAAKVLTNG